MPKFTAIISYRLKSEPRKIRRIKKEIRAFDTSEAIVKLERENSNEARREVHVTDIKEM